MEKKQKPVKTGKKGEDPDPKKEGAPEAMRGKNGKKKTNEIQKTPTGEKLTTKGQKNPK